MIFRLLNKKESEDQAHVYVPAERKPKLEEAPRSLGHGKLKPEIPNSLEPEQNVITPQQSVDDQLPEPMDVEINEDHTAENTQPITKSTFQNNLENNKVEDENKKPTLTNEVLENFKKSISYVSKILNNVLPPFLFLLTSMI